jgi:hypothetical protein
MVIKFMNYIASDEYNEAPEEVENDRTVWTWCKWASATIKQRRRNGLTINEIKLLQSNGKINSIIMDQYVRTINKNGHVKAYIQETILVKA